MAVAEAWRVLARLEAIEDRYDRRDVILYALLAFGDRQQCGEWSKANGRQDMNSAERALLDAVKAFLWVRGKELDRSAAATISLPFGSGESLEVPVLELIASATETPQEK